MGLYCGRNLTMPLKAVLFDMFDTLAIIEKNHGFYKPSLTRMYSYLCEKGVKSTFEEFDAAYTKAVDELAAKSEANLEEPHFNVRVALTLKALGYSYAVDDPLVEGATGEFCSEFMKYVRVENGTSKLLEELHGRYKLGIVSNFAIPECVTKLLKRDKLESYFGAVIVSGAINKRKPAPQIYQTALDALGVCVSEAVFVGDTIDADVEGPKRIGMRVVFLERRVKYSGEAGADWVIKGLDELPPILEKC
jgi:HAD superfamily hydrolase (TIGR01549 family)